VKSLEHVLAELRTVERAEVLAWVEANWVRPASDEGGMGFDPVDVARVHLIRELRHDLAVDAEAMPVVLSLLDEMYALRRRLGALARALAEAPTEVRSTVFTRCQVLLREVEEDAGGGTSGGAGERPG
jgi:chaperone modulatory protein CbpM